MLLFLFPFFSRFVGFAVFECVSVCVSVCASVSERILFFLFWISFSLSRRLILCQSFCARFIPFFSFIDIFFFISSFSSKKIKSFKYSDGNARRRRCAYAQHYCTSTAFIYFFKGKN